MHRLSSSLFGTQKRWDSSGGSSTSLFSLLSQPTYHPTIICHPQGKYHNVVISNEKFVRNDVACDTHRGTCYFFLCSVSPDLPNQNLHGFNGMDDFYIKPWCRFQPYLMGLLLGYILFKLRGKTIHIPQVTI